MNYVTEALNFHLGVEREFNSVLVEQMQQEALYMNVIMENMLIVTEAVAPAATDKKEGIFKRIAEFIKRIFDVFTKKAKALVESNKDWLTSNKDTLAKLDYSGLQLEILPFWNIDLRKQINDLKSLVDRVINTTGKNFKDTHKDIENVKKEYFSIYLDDDGELTNGAKNYFRVGKPSSKAVRPVSLAGDELKRRIVGNFHPFCVNYLADTSGQLNAVVNSATNRLNMIGKSLDEKKAAEPSTPAQPTKESFCVLENAFYADTELMFATNMIMLEAEQAAASANAAPAPEAAPKTEQKVSATKVTLQNNGDNKTTELSNKLTTLSTDHTIILKNIAQCVQIITAAALTAAEERYTAYMNAMRQVHNTRGGTTASAESSKDDGGKKRI